MLTLLTLLLVGWACVDARAAQASGPVVPVPGTLWTPPASALPASGSYVYLVSDADDWIGQGRTYLYTKANSVLTITADEQHLAITVDGDEGWSGDFRAMSPLTSIQVGYYPGLTRYPFDDAAVGGFDWSGEGRGSNTLTAWVAVDSVTYSGGTLSAIDLRFEQHSEGGGPALHGAIHWDASDPTQPPGPVVPVPESLWKPPAAALPSSGSYVYLASDAGDWIGQGQTHLYTKANAVLGVSQSNGLLTVNVNGDESWTGDFKAMSSLAQLQPGYYAGLGRYPFNNPVKGGLDWYGEGRGSNTLTGWFAVDEVTYTNGTLSDVDLRFELHSEGGGPALHGAVHWDASDPTQPPGPVVPVPAGLWRPSASAVPSSGDYIYLDSDPGDYIGQGQKYLYVPSQTTISVSGSSGLLSVSVSGSDWWYGRFQAMSGLSRLEPGYYSGLERYPFHNPVKGGLDWYGNGRGSNTLTGWFAVDRVTYTGSVLTAVDLRFELHSEGGAPALHGMIHWGSGEPPGPTPTPTATPTPTPTVTAPGGGGTMTRLGLTAPLVCGYGSAMLEGSLAGTDGLVLSGASVSICSYTGGTWTAIGAAMTDATGKFVFAVAPTTATTYQAVFGGNTKYARSTSATTTLLPRVLLSAPSAPRTARTTRTFTCSCVLQPLHAAGTSPVWLQCQRFAGGRWVTRKTAPATATDSGAGSTCAATLRLGAAGSWRIRAVHDVDVANAATTSRWTTVKVTR